VLLVDAPFTAAGCVEFFDGRAQQPAPLALCRSLIFGVCPNVPRKRV
jgi:hypothetical protein